MSLSGFLESIRARVLDGIGASGDSPEKLYAPKTFRDSRDKSAAEFSVRVMAVESAEGHEAWLTVWSRDGDEIDRIDTVLRSAPEWEEVGDRQSGERLFRKHGTSITFGFGDDGTATMLHGETGRTRPFGRTEYRELIETLWDGMTRLLMQTAPRAPSAEEARAEAAPSAAPDAWGAVSSRTDTVLGGLAVERGYLSREQVDEAVEIQRKLRDEMGVDQPLVQVLIGKHWLSADQAQELRAAAAVQTGEARLVAGYEAFAKLGRGGMGAVYKARRVGTEEFVALKILPPSLADKEMIARFRRESEIVKKLHHDNIVGSIEFGFDKRRRCYFCALELVEGEDLGKRIPRLGMLSEDEAVSITAQIASALQYAYFNGLVHRDVKPENIMVTSDGTAKLLDLGLARPANKEATRLTESGIFIGSPYYASPEQALGQKEVDTRADIYSLGATLYHMVTGKPPFEGTTAVQILQKHLTERLPWPAEVNPDISDGLCEIIAKMMVKSPDDRYQTPNDLHRDLDLLVEGEEPEVSEAVLRKSSLAVPAIRPRRRRRDASPARAGADRRPRVAKDRERRAPKRAEREGRDVREAPARAAADRRPGRRRRESARERRRETERQAPVKVSGWSALPTYAKITILVAAGLLVAVILAMRLLGGEEPDRPRPGPPRSGDTLRTGPRGGPVRNTKAEEDFFAKLRRESEERLAGRGAPRATPIVEFGGHRYRLYKQKMTWHEAKRFCEEQGGHLVTITSEEENRFVIELARKARGNVWIGLTDEREEGHWEWVTGEKVTFTRWVAGEPNNWKGREHYGHLWRAKGLDWDDTAAEGAYDKNAPFICEWEPGAAAPSSGPSVRPVAGTDLARGLVGHWEFDEGEGTTARDSSGRGNHGKIVGAMWAKGRLGGALEFDGKDDHVELPAIKPTNTVDNLTCAVWISLSSVAGRYDSIFSRDAWATGSLHLIFCGRKPQFSVGASKPEDVSASAGFAAGEIGHWVHIAVVYDRTLKTATLYRNGRTDRTARYTTARSVSLGPAWIGGWRNWQTSRSGEKRYFNGKMDDFRIYNRALTGDEIRALAASE